MGWTLHFGRVFNGLGTDVAPPVIEMPDGSQHQTFHHISPPSGCTACYVTREFWIYDKNTATLTLPNGTTYTFGHPGTAGSGTALYATAIADAFGNSVAITYMSDPSDGIASLMQDLSGGQTRQVTFTVEPSRKSLSTMTFLSRTWTYTQTAIAEAGFSELTTAQPPVGSGWSFTYKASSPGQYELSSLTSPNGGQITYAYAEQTFHLGSTVPVRTMSMTQRTIGGRDITAGSWTYAYAQGSGQNQTIVTGPCNNNGHRSSPSATLSSGYCSIRSCWQILTRRPAVPPRMVRLLPRRTDTSLGRTCAGCVDSPFTEHSHCH